MRISYAIRNTVALLLLTLGVLRVEAAATVIRAGVVADTNGVILWPTNIFSVNAALINAAISNSSSATNIIYPVAGTNMIGTTNGLVVTLNAEVSRAELTNRIHDATNGLPANLGYTPLTNSATAVTNTLGTVPVLEAAHSLTADSATSAATAAAATTATTANNFTTAGTNQWRTDITTATNTVRAATQPTNSVLTVLGTLNGNALTNLNGANITGTVTNNTTGNAATATLATTATAATLATTANNITAGATLNAVNGANITNLAQATHLTTGALSTNDFTFAQSAAGWQGRISRLPGRFQVAGTEGAATNLIYWHNQVGKFGYDTIMGFETQFYNTRTNGHLVFNATNFTSGLAGYKTLLRTNGWKWAAWYDSANSTVQGSSSVPQFIDDIQTVASFGPSLAWIDEYGYRSFLASYILSTNVQTIPAMFGLLASDIDKRTIQLGSSWRIHVSGDVDTWPEFIETAELIESNAWKYVGPGQTIYLGPELASIGTTTETASGVAMQALWSCVFGLGFCGSAANSYGPYTVMTNQNILDIQGDWLVQPARRQTVTNGCWWMVKPTYDPSGSFVVGVLNTNAITTNTIATFAALNLGPAPSSYFLGAPSYTVYNLKGNGWAWIGDSMTSITNTSLASHDYGLWKLVPTRQYFGPSVMTVASGARVMSSSVWTRVTQEDYSAFGAGYQRFGWRQGTGVGAVSTIEGIPSWATNVSGSFWVSCTTNAAFWQIFLALYRQELDGTLTAEASSTLNIQGTNGLQQVTFNLPVTVPLSATPLPRIYLESWAASTNTGAIRGIVGDTVITNR